MSSLRQPVVAGKFYPLQPEELRRAVSSLLPSHPAPSSETVAPVTRAKGALVPHAGYVYSGGCAARTLAAAGVPSRVVLLGPNHTGRGPRLAASSDELWRSPLGNVPVDREFLESLCGEFDELSFDTKAHRSEHSLEVQLPFLQTLGTDVRIAPIVVGTSSLEMLLGLGDALARVLAAADDTLVLVSSDMTHYEPASIAARKDRLALDRLEALDPEGLHAVVSERSITMCGFAPAVAALRALVALGVTEAEEICYTHSGHVTGDDRDVVAYAGVLFR